MSPCMTGNQKTLDPDAVNIKDLSIVKQLLFVVLRCEYSNAFSTPIITCSASRWLSAPFTLMMSRRV